ncbi:CDP-diacylglycerol--glycerol-3-phosphate 3-phosphatidyltransferase 1 [Chlorella vulgaris]
MAASVVMGCQRSVAQRSSAGPRQRHLACLRPLPQAAHTGWLAAALPQHPNKQHVARRLRQLLARGGVRVLAAGGSSSGSGTVLTVPTMLTLVRLTAVPALVAGWYSSAPWAAGACTALFVGASITDWLDGYLARKMNAYSAFGAFLDPVADKLMVATTMILLCTRPLPLGVMAGNAWLLPLLTTGEYAACLTPAARCEALAVVIGREITMSALREWAAALGPEAHAAVAVSWVGKWKTATQMASLTLLLLAHQGVAAAAGSGGVAVPPAVLQAAGSLGVPLLVVATGLTVWSLALYFNSLWRYF